MSGKRVLCTLRNLSNVRRSFNSATPPLKYSRHFCTTKINSCGKFVTNPSDLVSQEQADELIRRLRQEEINLLKTAIEHFESHADRAEYEGKRLWMYLHRTATGIPPATHYSQQVCFICVVDIINRM